jgi:predicted ATP-dependent endonuclease of OLD family
MKIQILNFGPIHRFKCDLNKDLHIIVGENNVGKSYAITVVYLILKSLIDFDDWYFRRFFYKEKMRDNIPSEVVNLKSGKEANISDIFKAEITKILENTFVKKFQHYFNGTYDSVESIISQFTDEELYIKLLFEEVSIDLRIDHNAFKISRLGLRKNVIARCVKQNRTHQETTKEIVIYHHDGDVEYFKRDFSEATLSFYFKVLEEVLSKIRSIHYLPASRSGLYQALTAFGQIVAQLSKSRSFVNDRIELPAISVPLSDYFLELSEIKINRKSYEKSPINKVAEEIETNILKGQVEFDSKNKKLFYRPNETNLKLDIHSTSSMVSELSPIVSFLRHILTQSTPRRRTHQNQASNSAKSLIFIEEPEAHLHPQNQVKLIKAFVSLIGANVKIIITSHSNYIFNKLNNLILEQAIDVNTIQASILKLSKTGSNMVALQIDELGIEDDNFVDVAEDLYEEKVELIAKINSDA